MTRTSQAHDRLLALYRSGTATGEELRDAARAYDEAATAEGVQAVVDATGPLTPEQRHTLAVLLTPPPHPTRARRRPSRPISRDAGTRTERPHRRPRPSGAARRPG